MRLTIWGFLLCIGLSTTLWGTPYVLEPTRSSISFDASHLGQGVIQGHFKSITATLNWTESSEDFYTTGTLEVKSLDTGNRVRDKHLLSRVFFNESRYPTISFSSTELTPSQDHYIVSGTLHLKGISLPHSFPIIITPTQNNQIIITADTNVNRHDYSVSAYKKIINPLIRVYLELVFVQD